jgi:ribonuclease HI
MIPVVEVYTDGACRGNPGPGGWGAIFKRKSVESTLSGAEAHTTNNRMELMAAISALESLSEMSKVLIYTDSEYVKKGITEWVDKWIKKGWKTAKHEPVKNRDLWQRLLQAEERHQVEWHWVKAHNNHPDNDRADELARAAIDVLLERT